MLYLFIGQDSPYQDSSLSCKDLQLKKIKERSFPKEMEQFNLDLLYGDGLKLKELQERLLLLPVEAGCRVIVIRNAQELEPQIDAFLVQWAKDVGKKTILVLDIEDPQKKETLIRNLSKYAQTIRFKENLALTTFTLARSIEQRRTAYALKVLGELLKDGERPERILGGLRYRLEKSLLSGLEIKRRVKLLLDCDIEIKTGKVSPTLALEKLTVKLTSLVQPLG